MFRPRQPYSRPAIPIAAPSLSSLFATKRTRLTPLFSYSSALFKKECFPKPFAIKLFRALLQSTGGHILQTKGFLGHAFLRHRIVSNILLESALTKNAPLTPIE
jgi:hypothetical protein